MTKRKLRKNADINPPQSPYDGIHTCSKGCKKPGCNRTLRDTIEEQDQQIKALKRDVLEKAAKMNKPAVIGGYNISEYIRMANSETLEFDNGDIFADMTLPERIKYIVESHARLKAEVERLRKAGDELLHEWSSGDERDGRNFMKGLLIWNAAKEGKPQP
jgi:hypothetical protein